MSTTLNEGIEDILDEFTYHAFGRILQGENRSHYYTQARTQILEAVRVEVEKERAEIPQAEIESIGAEKTSLMRSMKIAHELQRRVGRNQAIDSVLEKLGGGK